ncbi:MAG: HAD hydrolase-like protein [Nitrospinae bacterium]|nr:HAD hydrolase-like protein [Nitrospinota bacterium]
MNSIHLILFDVDGTLLLSGGAGAAALNIAFKRMYGIPNAMRHVRPHGKTDELIVQEMFRSHLERRGSESEVKALLKKYVEILPTTVRESKNFHLMPGIPDLLSRLKNRTDVFMGLGTGNIEAGARIKLSRGGLNEFFSFGGFGSDSGDRAELLEAGFQRGEAIIEKIFPRDSVSRWVIGDTWRDVSAGRVCGASTIAVATGGDSLYELASASPDFLFATLENKQAVCELLDGGVRA